MMRYLSRWLNPTRVNSLPCKGPFGLSLAGRRVGAFGRVPRPAVSRKGGMVNATDSGGDTGSLDGFATDDLCKWHEKFRILQDLYCRYKSLSGSREWQRHAPGDWLESDSRLRRARSAQSSHTKLQACADRVYHATASAMRCTRTHARSLITDSAVH
jgi:hypothetical protein